MIWHIYAFIKDGVVKDTWHSHMGLDVATMRARAVYGDSAYAVECTTCYVQIGDTYSDGKFYHDGVEVPVVPDVLNYDTYFAQINDQLDDIVVALSPEEE